MGVVLAGVGGVLLLGGSIGTLGDLFFGDLLLSLIGDSPRSSLGDLLLSLLGDLLLSFWIFAGLEEGVWSELVSCDMLRSVRTFAGLEEGVWSEPTSCDLH